MDSRTSQQESSINRYPAEIILVNGSSPDAGATWNAIKSIEEKQMSLESTYNSILANFPRPYTNEGNSVYIMNVRDVIYIEYEGGSSCTSLAKPVSRVSPQSSLFVRDGAEYIERERWLMK